MEEPQYAPDPSSFRDPSGFVFRYNKDVYRQVNQSYKNDFGTFITSGLYESLVKDGLLLAHTEIQQNFTGEPDWLVTLRPEQLSLITYPYEWTFGMLKDAALLTVEIALRALEFGMLLKDASAFNVQLYKGRMVFIDTLSFENYTEGRPWIAYRQFCEHFLGPLALHHYLGLPAQKLLMIYPDGIPLLEIKNLLPYKSRFHLNVYLHLHLHASYAKKGGSADKEIFLSKQKLVNLLKSLQQTIASFQFRPLQNIWASYYDEAATRPGYLEEKKQIVSQFLAVLSSVKSVIDVGGNNGEFAVLAKEAEQIICADGDHSAIEQLYQIVKKGSALPIVPLLIDFTNPSPAIGINNTERSSFFTRAASDLAMVLAFVHHLAIGKNVPFDLIAKLCRQLGSYLIIEFVPKEDEKVQLMLHQKKDIYTWYTEETFLTSFARYYRVLKKQPLTSSPRTLYLMKAL